MGIVKGAMSKEGVDKRSYDLLKTMESLPDKPIEGIRAQKKLMAILDSGKFYNLAIWQTGAWRELGDGSEGPLKNSGKTGFEGEPIAHIKRDIFINTYVWTIQAYFIKVLGFGPFEFWNKYIKEHTEELYVQFEGAY